MLELRRQEEKSSSHTDELSQVIKVRENLIMSTDRYPSIFSCQWRRLFIYDLSYTLLYSLAIKDCLPSIISFWVKWIGNNQSSLEKCCRKTTAAKFVNLSPKILFGKNSVTLPFFYDRIKMTRLSR